MIVLCVFFSNSLTLLYSTSPSYFPPSTTTMSSANHHLWAFLNSTSDVDDDNERAATKTDLLPPPPTVGKKRSVAESDHEIHIWTERERRKKMRNMFSNLHALLPHLPSKADKSTIVDEAVNYIKTLQQTLQKLQTQKLEKLQNKNNNNPSGACNAVDPYHPQQQQQQPSSTTNHISTATATAATANAIDILPPPPPSGTTITTFQTWTSSNLVLSVCGGDAHFCVCSGKKPGLFAAVCYVLDKHQIEVVSAHVSSDFHRTFFMIQAHMNGDCDEFGAAMVAEEIFKQAAGEIIFWLSS